MSGKTCETITVALSRAGCPDSSPVSRVQTPFVLPVWEGWAGFGGENCVCIEARLCFLAISREARKLPCSFQEDAFSVRVKFGRV
jgi:hypothetical protein